MGAPMKTRLARRAGFTLIEILVVVLIIAILATIVSVNVLHKPAEARIAAAQMNLRAVKTALEMYHADNGVFPSQAQGLSALQVKPALDPVPRTYPEGGYLEVPRDPWGEEFIYLTPGRKGEPFEIITYGSDGEPGGEGEAADLSSSTRE